MASYLNLTAFAFWELDAGKHFDDLLLGFSFAQTHEVLLYIGDGSLFLVSLYRLKGAFGFSTRRVVVLTTVINGFFGRLRLLHNKLI